MGRRTGDLLSSQRWTVQLPRSPTFSFVWKNFDGRDLFVWLLPSIDQINGWVFTWSGGVKWRKETTWCHWNVRRESILQSEWPDWAILATHFHTTVALIFGDFGQLFKNVTFYVKPAVATFWVAFEIFGQLFIPISGHTDFSPLRRPHPCREICSKVWTKTFSPVWPDSIFQSLWHKIEGILVLRCFFTDCTFWEYNKVQSSFS